MSITEIDANGRIRLPMGIRYRLDLNDGDKLAIDQLGDGTIILKKLAQRMSFDSGVIGLLNHKNINRIDIHSRICQGRRDQETYLGRPIGNF